MRFDPAVDDSADIHALATEKVEEFCKTFVSEKAFIDYFRSQWEGKIGK